MPTGCIFLKFDMVGKTIRQKTRLLYLRPCPQAMSTWCVFCPLVDVHTPMIYLALLLAAQKRGSRDLSQWKIPWIQKPYIVIFISQCFSATFFHRCWSEPVVMLLRTWALRTPGGWAFLKRTPVFRPWVATTHGHIEDKNIIMSSLSTQACSCFKQETWGPNQILIQSWSHDGLALAIPQSQLSQH